MGLVEGGKRDDEEGGGVFAGVGQVREGSLGVTVTAQALHEAEPGGQTLDDGAQAVRVLMTHTVSWETRGNTHDRERELITKKRWVMFLTLLMAPS